MVIIGFRYEFQNYSPGFVVIRFVFLSVSRSLFSCHYSVLWLLFSTMQSCFVVSWVIFY